MEYSHKKGRGSINPKGPAPKSTKVFIHKDASYLSVLNRLKREIYSEEDDNTDKACTYYLSDSSGTAICSDEATICIQGSDGSEKQVPWTLQTYMSLKKMMYPSRFKLYCVRKPSGMLYTRNKH